MEQNRPEKLFQKLFTKGKHNINFKWGQNIRSSYKTNKKNRKKGKKGKRGKREGRRGK